MIPFRGQLARWFWGCYILFWIVLIFLPAVQSAALNTTGKAMIFGVNLAVPIDFFAHTSAIAGKAMGNRTFSSFYYSFGPPVNDPLYHSAWPYWGAPLVIWGLGSVLAIILLWFVGFWLQMFLPASDAELPPGDSSSFIAGVWQALPGLWPRVDTRQMDLHQVDAVVGSRLMQRGVLVVIPAVIMLWVGVGRGMHSLWLWLGVVVAIFAYATLREGSRLLATSRAGSRADAAAREELKRQLVLMDATKNSRGSKDYKHELMTMARQMAHELAKAEIEERRDEKKREHLRWSQVVRQTENLMRSILLAQAELRNNPAAEDIMRQLKDLYDTTRSFNPDAEPDPEATTAMYERIMLARMAKQYDVNLNGV